MEADYWVNGNRKIDAQSALGFRNQYRQGIELVLLVPAADLSRAGDYVYCGSRSWPSGTCHGQSLLF